MSKYQCRACGSILEIAQAASTTFCPRCGKRGTFVLEVLDSAGNVLGTQSVTLGS